MDTMDLLRAVIVDINGTWAWIVIAAFVVPAVTSMVNTVNRETTKQIRAREDASARRG